MSGSAESEELGPAGTFAVNLSAKFEAALSFQTYGQGPAIDGISCMAIRKNIGENGWFSELFRLTDGKVEGQLPALGLNLRQVSAAYAAPDRINAFHIHPKIPQDEIWTVVQGSLLVWLVDCRADSPTEGVRQRIQLSGDQPARLFIPAGVAHGYRAGRQGALLIYGMNQQFDPAEPNEGRLPWNFFGEELWEEDRG